jgi:hypothetical protein
LANTTTYRVAALLAVWAVAAGCDRIGAGADVGALPTVAQVQEFYAEHPSLTEVRISGNVVELRFQANRRNLRRGGSLWARAGLYVQLLSPATRDLLTAWEGIAAVRALSMTNGQEIGRATLLRDELSEIEWQRTLNLLGHALRDGTERPSRLQELAEWGEQHTEYQYDPDYVPASR